MSKLLEHNDMHVACLVQIKRNFLALRDRPQSHLEMQCVAVLVVRVTAEATER